MKKCYICKKELLEEDQGLCEECLTFFKWKHGKDFQEILDLHKANAGDLKKQIKFRRKK